MVYVISNIHGNYTKFTEMLEKISFTDNDIMYVLGDVVDYGDEAMEIICDLSVRMNVYPVMGEHDATAYKMLSGFDEMVKKGGTPDADFIAEMQIALKECYETEYWLRLFVKTNLINDSIYSKLSTDSGKIRRILISSINTAKENA